MSMLHWTPPRETEAGNPGEEPAKGYLGQAHQTMRLVLTDRRRGVHSGASPILKTPSDDRPAMPQKTHPETCGVVPQNCVQRTGRGTPAFWGLVS